METASIPEEKRQGALPDGGPDVVLCPACRSRDVVQACNEAMFYQTIEHSICRDCGLLFITEPPTREQYARFYTEYYGILYGMRHGGWRKFLTKAAACLPDRHAQECKQGRKIANLLAPLVAEPVGGVLEIGCACGGIARMVGERLRAERTDGMELDQAKASVAREHLDHVYAGSWDNLLSLNLPVYDLVLMVHVLEHEVEPHSLLRRTREILKRPAGLLFIVVPNLLGMALGSRLQDKLQLAHPLNFSPRSLAIVVEKAGYEILSLRTSSAETHCVARVSDSPRRKACHMRGMSLRELHLRQAIYHMKLCVRSLVGL